MNYKNGQYNRSNGTSAGAPRPMQNGRTGTPNRNTGPSRGTGSSRAGAPMSREAEMAKKRAEAERRFAEMKRRQAERERRRIFEENRRRTKRRHTLRVIGGRMLIFLVIFILLAIVSAVAFFLHFNATDKPSEPSHITYTFGGADGDKLAEDIAYANGTVYVDFDAVADYLSLTKIGGGDSMRYIITDATTDSAGNGAEEDVIFYAGKALAVVNGQPVQMEASAVLYGDRYLVPLSFVSDCMRGVAASVSDGAVSVSRIYTDEEGTIAEPISFVQKAAEPIDPLPLDGVDNTVAVAPEDLVVSFKSDLSAYEEYMLPVDRDGYLTLVNNKTPLAESYLPSELTNVTDTRKDGRNTQKMVKAAAKSLEAMFIELRANGYTDLSVTSAYRSYSYQDTLFKQYTDREMANNPSLTRAQAEAITETYSARPGTSEHQTGLCCDMHNLPSASQAFANKEAYLWLKDNAWKFGFILRFPEGKEDITGITFEPWHYRFVGRYHAKAMYDAGLCLEEYLEALH